MKYQKASEEEAMVAARTYAIRWDRPVYVYSIGAGQWTIEAHPPFFSKPHCAVYPGGAIEQINPQRV